jgi:predicted SAM-dependent methyltransferase
MSTQYYIVAEGLETVEVFSSLYKMQGILLASAPNWKIEDVIEHYYSEGPHPNYPNEEWVCVLMRLIRFIIDNDGSEFYFFRDQDFYDYMNEKVGSGHQDWNFEDTSFKLKQLHKG